LRGNLAESVRFERNVVFFSRGRTSKQTAYRKYNC
jgi:hypothetical protein